MSSQPPTSHHFPFTASAPLYRLPSALLTVPDAACADFVMGVLMMVWITHGCLNVGLHASSQPIMFAVINVCSLTRSLQDQPCSYGWWSSRMKLSPVHVRPRLLFKPESPAQSAYQHKPRLRQSFLKATKLKALCTCSLNPFHGSCWVLRSWVEGFSFQYCLGLELCNFSNKISL